MDSTLAQLETLSRETHRSETEMMALALQKGRERNARRSNCIEIDRDGHVCRPARGSARGSALRSGGK